MLKVCLDPLPQRALAGTVAVAIVTAADEKHSRAVAHALTAVLAEMGACLPAPPRVLLDTDVIAAQALTWAHQYSTAIGHALANAGHLPALVR